jgi:hypothetical protein
MGPTVTQVLTVIAAGLFGGIGGFAPFTSTQNFIRYGGTLTLVVFSGSIFIPNVAHYVLGIDDIDPITALITRSFALISFLGAMTLYKPNQWEGAGPLKNALNVVVCVGIVWAIVNTLMLVSPLIATTLSFP